MVLVAMTVVGAIIAGYAAGGRLGHLAEASIARGWLLFVAIAAQGTLAAVAAAGGPADALSRPLLALSHVGVLAFLWSNRLLPGVPLAFVGFGLNVLVITANGAMPVSRGALLTVSPYADVEFTAAKHQLLRDGDPLWFLADIIPLAALRTVISVGDVILAAGVAVLVVHLMRRRRRIGSDVAQSSAAEPVEGAG